MEASAWTAILGSLDAAPPALSASLPFAPSPSLQSLQQAVTEAQALFNVKWNQANEAWQVLQLAKVALNEHEMALLQKEATKQLKVQKLLEFMAKNEASESKSKDDPGAGSSSTEAQVKAFNDMELEVDRKRKLCQEMGRQHEERQKAEMAKRAKQDAQKSEIPDSASEPPKPKARPKSSSASSRVPDGAVDVTGQLAQMGLKITLEPLKNENEKTKMPQKAKNGKMPSPPESPPPCLGGSR